MKSEEYFLQRKKEIINYYYNHNIDEISFIGIDRSVAATGFAIVKNGKCILKKEIKSKYYGPQRLIGISKEIIDSLPNSPHFILFESYAYAAHSRSVTILAELFGILSAFLFLKQHKYLEIPPTLLKKYICGSGISPKSKVMMHILKKFKIECATDNIADAVGLAFFAFNAFKFVKKEKTDYTIKEQECFSTFFGVFPKPKQNKKNKSTKQLALEIHDE